MPKLLALVRTLLRPRTILMRFAVLCVLASPAASQLWAGDQDRSPLLSELRAGALAQARDGALYVPGRLIVIHHSRLPTRQAAALERYALKSMHHFASLNADVVTLPAQVDAEQLLRRVRRDPAFQQVELDYALFPAIVPDDLGELQWNLDNFGQRQGLFDADVDAPEAWEKRRDCRNVIVAVVDTGIKLDHPDLVSNLWHNEGELPGNGIDDDGNGYLDDDQGWDFHQHDNVPMDDVNHGTHISGIIGGVGNNGMGVVGVCWQARLMPVKAFGRFWGATSNVVAGMEYAMNNGARIINASFSGSRSSELMRRMIDELELGGVLVVAAAGNDAEDIDASPVYPACYPNPNLLVVTATTRNDLLASFSNFGPVNVDLAAPGLDIYSTMVTQEYGLMSGTSMAVPHASAAAAMILSQNPELTPAVLRELMMDEADPLNSLQGVVGSQGRLNLLTALEDPLAQEGGQPSPYVP